MNPEHRAKLLELAARRGEKGFSSIVEEAIELFLNSDEERELDIREALAVRGSFSSKESEQFRERASRLRESWR